MVTNQMFIYGFFFTKPTTLKQKKAKISLFMHEDFLVKEAKPWWLQYPPPAHLLWSLKLNLIKGLPNRRTIMQIYKSLVSFLVRMIFFSNSFTPNEIYKAADVTTASSSK
jgi:hypothetical protein